MSINEMEFDSILTDESFEELRFTNEEYHLFQLFFKIESPLRKYFKGNKGYVTGFDAESASFGHGNRHISSSDKIPYVNELVANGHGNHDGLMRWQDKVKFDEVNEKKIKIKKN